EYENQPGPPYFYDYATDGSFTQAFFLFSGAASPNLNTPQTYINPPIVEYPLDENANFIDSIVTKIQPNDLSQLIHQLSVDDSVGIFFACGTNDDFLLHPAHLVFRDTLDLLGLPYEFYSHDGNHAMPSAFKQRAFTFLDSLLMPPIIITGIKAVAKGKTDIDLRNFPNPFDHSATIQFELFKSEYIELSIHNHLGQPVEIVIEGNMQAGKQKILFDASKLLSGIYFCRLQVGNEIITRKIIKL
ncbi:MAG: T9SS type A sorting domain-containing protein, partial [Bacteroidales bacterium]|nr:T9SS type A sorting domain-containing protein [Bacteroidales bacterium]